MDLKRYLNKQTSKRPLILPVILEIVKPGAARQRRLILTGCLSFPVPHFWGIEIPSCAPTRLRISRPFTRLIAPVTRPGFPIRAAR